MCSRTISTFSCDITYSEMPAASRASQLRKFSSRITLPSWSSVHRKETAAKNIRQVCDWLGHADPAFTLRTYVHLMDGGLGEVEFMDALLGNPWATQDPNRRKRSAC